MLFLRGMRVIRSVEEVIKQHKQHLLVTFISASNITANCDTELCLNIYY